MATPAYQTSASAQGDASTLVITKPASTVDGDLLIAILCSSGARTVSTLSGWTLITSGTNSDCNTYAYYKIASSEGANYTWTYSGTNNNYGWIGRINGHASNGFLTDFGVATGSGTTLTFADPLTTIVDTLFIYAVGHSQNDGNTNTISNYAIATNNPSSWTELIDLQDSTVDSGGLAIAYGSRAASGTTGNYSASSSDTDTLAVGILLAIQGPADATTSPAVIEVATSVHAPTVTGGASASPAVISVATSVQDPTVTTPADVWSKQAKNTTTWTTQDKS